MSSLRLHLWREWREHRTTLVMLVVALPLLALLVSRTLARGALANPLVQDSFVLGFVAIMLVAVGGELLGVDRRSSGLRWLDRLPSGLGTAFWAKVVLLLATTVFAGALGLTAMRAINFLRNVEAAPSELEIALALAGILVITLWTFACSAWVLRGGVALLSSLAALGLAAYPLIHVLTRGFQLSEARIGGWLLVAGICGCLAAWSAFVHGGRLGRGVGWPMLLGLVPTLPIVALSSGWGLLAIEERERLDPLADDFEISDAEITDCGTRAFLVVRHDAANWERDAMPSFVLRASLADGSWERIGEKYISHEIRSTEGTDGLFRASQLLIYTTDSPQGVTFDLSSGQRTELDPDAKRANEWNRLGLGQEYRTGERAPFCIRDPFRTKDYLKVAMPEYVLVRPGDWICSDAQGEKPYFLLDPDSMEWCGLDWAPTSSVIRLFVDGRVLLRSKEGDLHLVDPDSGDSLPIACDPVIVSSLREYSPLPPRQEVGAPEPELELLDSDWLLNSWPVLDLEAKAVRTLPLEYDGETHVGMHIDGRVFLIGDDRVLFTLDPSTGQREALFPRRTAD